MEGRSKKVACLVFIFLLFLPSLCNGQGKQSVEETLDDLTRLSLEELMEIEIDTVYGASRYSQKVTEAPSSVSIITAEEIKRFGYRNLAEILNSVRGFYISYDRNYHYLGVRGFSRPGDYNSRILLLIDGHRLNDSIFYNAPIGTDFPVDIDLIERIEIIRGPSSSLYGTNAFFAVINIITRKGTQIKASEASAEYGSFNTFKGRLTHGSMYKKDIDLILSASYYDSEGDDRLYYREYDSPSTNNGIAEDLDYDRFKHLFLNTNVSNFTIQGLYSYRKKGVPTASYDSVFNDQRYYTREEYFYIDLKYESTLHKDISLLARVNYNYFYDYGTFPFDYADEGDPPDIRVNKEHSKGEWIGSELKLTKEFFGNHKLTMGGEYINNFRQEQKSYDIVVYLDDKRSSQIWALFLQDEFKPLDSLIINAGVRYDHYETFGESVSPRIALIYSPLERTYMKFIYGKAFRAPSVYELYYNDGEDTQKANPDLNPEKIDVYEMIIEKYLNRSVRATISLFYYRTKDLITLTTDPADDLLVFKNIDEVKAKGIEFELEGRFEGGLQGRLSYSYQKVEDYNTDELITNSPQHLAKLNILFPVLKDRFYAGLEILYTGKRRTLADCNTGEYFLTNLTFFGSNFYKNLEASFSIYNLFDRQYSDPASEEHRQDSIRQNGRTYRFKITYRF